MRFGEIAASASGVLFSNAFVTVSIPADAISIGTRLGCGVCISASPTSCSPQQPRRSRPARCAGSSSSSAPPPSASRRPSAVVPMPRSSQPSANAPARPRAPQREHAELEQVARRVRLRPRVEQQPARRAARELAPDRAASTGVIAFWNATECVASPGRGEDAEPAAAEPLVQQLGREQRAVREAVGLLGQRRPACPSGT